ncbi:MAG: aldo/keto reductase [Oscillospiraceae bacterium]|nr:aldo/keto reductase [Oscillospiraceae bacterium]
MEYVTLNNGVKMPMLGFGVYQIPPEDCCRLVLDALEVGYRAIDTAQQYCNESGVGEALARCGIPREELFLTTKIWISNAGYEQAAASIDESLRRLKTDYLDLMLVHQPFGDYYGTYRAMEDAYRAGKLRAIGVSNFYPDRLIDICQFAGIKPAVNQIETHVLHQRKVDHLYMEKYGVQHQSWGPFAEGRNGFFTHPVLSEIAAAHGRSVAQVALRFLLQSNVVVIPKSSHKSRMAENLNVFDFALTTEEMDCIRAADTATSAFFSHYDPETVEMITELAKQGLD